MLDSLNGAIVRLFDELSSQYWDEQSKNIHYYNGWRTNMAHRINKKIITRLDSYGYLDNWPRPVTSAIAAAVFYKFGNSIEAGKHLGISPTLVSRRAKGAPYIRRYKSATSRAKSERAA